MAQNHKQSAPPEEAFRQSVLASLPTRTPSLRSSMDYGDNNDRSNRDPLGLQDTSCDAGIPDTGGADTTMGTPNRRSGKRARHEMTTASTSTSFSSRFTRKTSENSQAPPPRRGGLFGEVHDSPPSSKFSSSVTSRPSQLFGRPNLVRRRSSLFDSLPSKSKSRQSAVTSNYQKAKTTKQESCSKTHSEETGGFAVEAETKPSQPISFLQRLSQNSTLMAEDWSSHFPGTASASRDSTSNTSMTGNRKRKRGPPGSLFGAVMKQLGGSSSSTATSAPTTPTKSHRSAQDGSRTLSKDGRDEARQHAIKRGSATTTTNSAGFMSPSGKSIMNIVNSFVINSPFRFQSPGRAKRRLLTKSPSKDDSNGARTPPPRKPDSIDLATPSTKSHLEDSRSSLHEDQNWQEARLCEGRAEILDWSLRRKIRLESNQAVTEIRHAREWKTALTHWQFGPVNVPVHKLHRERSSIRHSPPPPKASQEISTGKGEPSALLRRTSSIDSVSYFTYHMTNEKKSKKLCASEESRIATKKASKDTSQHEPSQKETAMELATRLVRTVRGSRAAASNTRNVMGATKGANTSEYKMTKNPSDQDSMKVLEWKQAFRSLYLQWCQHLVNANMNDVEQNQKTILDDYFYAISEDHVVLFRVEKMLCTEQELKNHGQSYLGKYTPRVLISKCGESFLQDLRDAGVLNTEVLEDKVYKDFERDLLDLDQAKGNNKLLPVSPTVKADLEALRKAQAYGEVAGADVSIKIKAQKPTMEERLASRPQRLAIAVAGMDEVATFFEVYWNRLGCVHEEALASGALSLPTLICPHELGPFSHASMKPLRVSPGRQQHPDKLPSSTSPSLLDPRVLEIEGWILPSTIRRLIGLSAKKVCPVDFQGEQQSFEVEERSKDYSIQGAESDYVVLHTMIPTLPMPPSNNGNISKDEKGVEEASIVFNGQLPQREASDHTNKAGGSLDRQRSEWRSTIPECNRGTAFELIVWQMPRANVVACKMGQHSRGSLFGRNSTLRK